MYGVEMPLWMVFLTAIAGPTLVYLWEHLIKPWRDKRAESEGDQVKRAYAQADDATKKLFDVLKDQIAEYKNANAECERRSDEQGKELTGVSVRLAMVEKDNTSLVERVSTLTALNDRLRRFLQRLEAKSPELFDDPTFND